MGPGTSDAARAGDRRGAEDVAELGRSLRLPKRHQFKTWSRKAEPCGFSEKAVRQTMKTLLDGDLVRCDKQGPLSLAFRIGMPGAGPLSVCFPRKNMVTPK